MKDLKQIASQVEALAAQIQMAMADAKLSAKATDGLTFAQFQELNAKRCNEAFAHGVFGWPPVLWALAICGEAGELANHIKKVERGEGTYESATREILFEVADVMTYCFLLMSYYGVDAGEVLMEKFDIVSQRVGWHNEAS